MPVARQQANNQSHVLRAACHPRVVELSSWLEQKEPVPDDDADNLVDTK